jgi:hypothetical protein
VSCKCKKLQKLNILGTPARNRVIIPLRRIHTVAPSWTAPFITSMASSVLTINLRPEAPFGRLTYKMFSQFSYATGYTFSSNIVNTEINLFALGQFHILLIGCPDTFLLSLNLSKCQNNTSNYVTIFSFLFSTTAHSLITLSFHSVNSNTAYSKTHTSM